MEDLVHLVIEITFHFKHPKNIRSHRICFMYWVGKKSKCGFSK